MGESWPRYLNDRDRELQQACMAKEEDVLLVA
jgi:hypothetical protein